MNRLASGRMRATTPLKAVPARVTLRSDLVRQIGSEVCEDPREPVARGRRGAGGCPALTQPEWQNGAAWTLVSMHA
jgi:hypothetical protein